MRGIVVAMPWLTLPAIEPDASNTIIASSVQGLRSPWSAAREGVTPAARKSTMTARGMADRIDGKTCLLNTNFSPKDQPQRWVARSQQQISQSVKFTD
jgi:hypothetical protein